MIIRPTGCGAARRMPAMLGVIATFFLSAHLAGQQEFDLPDGWKRAGEITVPPGQLAAFSEKLGGEIVSIVNTIYKADGVTFRFNTIQCRDANEANRVFENVKQINPRGMRLSGDTVYELSCSDPVIAQRALLVFGFAEPTQVYRIRLEAAPLAKADSMAINQLFNQLLIAESGDEAQRQKARDEIKELLPKFEFSDSLVLRRMGQGESDNQYSFDPQPTHHSTQGDNIIYHFENLPRKYDIPFVRVTAQIRCDAYTTIPPGETDAALKANTNFPANDRDIRQLAESITGPAETRDQKIERITQWISNKGNLKYGGEISGSRYGVKQVLEQKYGHCWDYSDTFITLGRASGVPCRQVAGWLYGGGPSGGHVWVEAQMDDGRWNPIDPTSGSECDTGYIPYITNESGEFPLLYLSVPTITVVD